MADFKTQLGQINIERANFEKQERALLSLQMRQQRGESISAATLQASKTQLLAAKAQVQSQIAVLHQDQTLDALVSNWEADVPLLMLPVRLQTRLVSRQQVSPEGGFFDLLVRIYPDDIHACSHEDILTENEVNAGMKYWDAIRLAEQSNIEEKNRIPLKKDAWRELTTQFGSGRSLYIAKVTTPLNRTALSQLTTADAIIFNKDAWVDTKNNAWSKAAKTPLLPDRFQVMVFKSADPNAAPQITKNGNLIPDTLQLGLDPLNETGNFKKKDGEITTGEDIKWLTDFTEAEKVGMGIRVPLPVSFYLPSQMPIAPTQPQGQALYLSQIGIARIVVVGTLTSADKVKSAELLQKTIENHLYTPKGFSFLKKGTPTNNTDENDSSWSIYSDPLSKGYYDGYKEFDDKDKLSDGARMAKALGMPKTTFQTVPNAGKTDFETARQMNKALYPTTVGYYFDELMRNMKVNRAELQSFFQDYVTGGGSYSAFRVGNQPYGVILTGGLANHKPFYQNLNRILTHLTTNVWLPLSNQTQRVGFGDNPEQTLIDILSMHPNSVEFGQQWFYPTDSMMVSKISSFEADKAKSNAIITNFLSQLDFGAPTPNLLGSLLNYTNQRVISLNTNNLVGPVAYEENALLNGASTINYLNWMYRLTSIRDLETVPIGTSGDVASLLFLMVRQSFLRLFAEAFEQLSSLPLFKTGEISKAVDITNKMDALRKATSFNLSPASPTTTLWEIFQISMALDDTAGTVTAPFVAQFKDKPLSDLLLSQAVMNKIVFSFKSSTNPAVLNTIRPISAFLDFKDSLNILLRLPAAELEQALMSHIDCASYRLDAWVDGSIASRLDIQRAAKPEGVYIGAFGWVENLKMRNSAQDTEGGFIHAPSPTHAVTAAVMKSAFLSHKKDNKSAFALNLSSNRVQRAQKVLEGLRSGERLEAILGYQFERELQDSSIIQGNTSAALITTLRQKYPIKVHQIAPTVDAVPIEVNSTQNVVNGLQLAEDFISNKPIQVTNPTIQKAAANLADTLDAVKDLLSAETAYRMAQGNFDAVGATLDALNKGTLPHEIGFTESARQPLFQFSNRVSLHFDTEGVTINFVESPRATLESGLNKWCSQLLGTPQSIGFTATFNSTTTGTPNPVTNLTLENLKIQPLDFVCLAANISELETRAAFAYRKKLGLTDDVTVSINFSETGLPNTKPLNDILPIALTIQRIINTARPLTAQDYLPSGATDTPSVIELTEFRQRTDGVINNLEQILNTIKSIPLSQTLILEGDNIQISTLGDVFNALKKIKHDATSDDWLPQVFPNAEALQNRLIQLSSYGVAEAFPRKVDFKNANSIVETIRQAATVVETTTQLLSETRVTLADLPVLNDAPLNHIESLVQLGKKILGGTMPILPRFKYTNASQIAESNSRRDELLRGGTTDPTPPEMKAEEWLQGAARVRPKLAQWETLRFMTASNLAISLDLMPVQVPTDALMQKQSDGSKKGIYTWIATEFPAGVSIRRDVVSMVVTGETASKTAQLQTGLLLDEWAETIPTDEELTALTFHYNQPNTEAPQSLLLAICPDAKWTWQAVVKSVTDTLLRSKMRTVDLMKIKNEGIKPNSSVAIQAAAQMLPMLIAPSNTQQHTYSLDYGVMKKEERDRIKTELTGDGLGHYQIWQD